MDTRGVREGMKVRDANGQSLGSVERCDEDAFLIQKGFFFPKDYLIHYGHIADIRDGEAWLRMTADELKAGDVSDVPAGREELASAGEEVRVPVAEEELEVEKHRQKTGEVGVRKHVTTEEKNITVPVSREEVYVERVPADQTTREGEMRFEEGETRVPVYEEEVELHKRPVVREEVRVGKTTEQRDERKTGKVRKEQVEVDERARPRDARR